MLKDFLKSNLEVFQNLLKYSLYFIFIPGIIFFLIFCCIRTIANNQINLSNNIRLYRIRSYDHKIFPKKLFSPIFFINVYAVVIG